MSAGIVERVVVTDATLDGVLEVRASLVRSGHDHRVDVELPREWDERHDGLYVVGFCPAALGRCAFVSSAGAIEWLS